MRILIANGTVVTAANESRADVLIEHDRIAAVGTDLPFRADCILDASGLYVMPGAVDVHTHLDTPVGDTTSADDFESGTIAAAYGGTTTVVDYAAQGRGEGLRPALDTWMAKAESRAAVDYGFHMTIADWSDAVEADMDALVAEGVSSFKLFMAYPGRMMLDDGAIFRAMARTAKNGGLACIHAENGGVIDVLVKRALAEGHTAPRFHALTRPPLAEAEATHRAIVLARMAGVPVYIVHVSAAEALDEIAAARAAGVPVFAETCPQYLFLTEDSYNEPGFGGAKYVMSPPLRSREACARLWRGLASSDLQTVATDHCPFRMKDQKVLGRDDFSKIPNGVPGIETRLPLLFDGGVRTGRVSLTRFVELVATAPARIFGLYPRKGTIAVGSDADIVLFDPRARWTISASSLHMRVDYSPYEGREVLGRARTVLLRGQVIVEDGRFVGRAGAGRFVRRRPRG
jgi:dihydropyrimidinase